MDEQHTPGDATPVALDHNFFPHIIRRIIHFSSGDVLVAFRQTSKTYQDLCHEILARHLVLSDGKPIFSCIKISSYRGPRSGLTSPGTNFDNLTWWVRRFPRVLNTCRIIDVRGPTSRNAPRVLAPALENLEVLRFLPTGRMVQSPLAGTTQEMPTIVNPVYSTHEFIYKVDTVVSFCGLPYFHVSANVLTMLRIGGAQQFPNSTRKLVFNVIASASYNSTYSRIFALSRFHPETFVLHFRFAPEEAKAQATHHQQSLRTVLECLPNSTIKVVDLGRRLELVDDLGSLAGRVNLMSGAEYCAEYGDEQYDLETCMSLS